LLPCSGWYEWRNEAGIKVKYFFEHADQVPLYMAGILFQHEMTELVTLTTEPNAKCAQFHKRMPVLILPEQAQYWFNASVDELEPLLTAVSDEIIKVTRG